MNSLSSRGRICSILVIVGLMLPAGASRAGADDTTPPAQNGDPLIVRDVGVYRLSAYGTNLNDRGLFSSTLPGYMLSRRPSASRDVANQPTPVSMITFQGPAEGDVDVLLEFDNGRFLTHWPPAQMRSRRLLWNSIDTANESSTAPASMPEDHWLMPLRQMDRLFMVGKKQAERFLLYDAELPYVPPVALSRSDNGYSVTNTGKFPVHDVVVYRPVEDGRWEVATAGIVEAAGKDELKEADADEKKGSSPSPTGEEVPSADQPAGEPSALPAEAVELAEDAGEEAAAPVVAEPASEAPATVAAPGTPEKPADGDAKQASAVKGATAEASMVGTLTANEAIEAWRVTLEGLNLEAAEVDFLSTILRHQALQNESAMLVYRLDEAQLEQLLPLEVTPYPDRLFRVALVIVQDADPDLQSEIETLVARLGDDEWRERESAQTQLKELGLAAKPKLEAALKDEDAEIVFRAEQLLEALKAE